MWKSLDEEARMKLEDAVVDEKNRYEVEMM
jgi:hypothetical protein